MALVTDNWTLNSYTNSTWTDLVAEPAILSTLIVTNTSGSSVVFSVRVEDSGTPLATIISNSTLTSNEASVIDTRSLVLTGTQKLQIFVDAAGAEFYTSGAK